MLYRLANLGGPALLLARRKEPAYVVEKIAAHPSDGSTVACMVISRETRTCEVHILRLSGLHGNGQLDLLTVLDRDLPSVPQSLTLEANESTKQQPLWIKLDDNQPTTQRSARKLHLSFALDGDHVVLAEEGVEADQDSMVRSWPSQVGGQPHRAILKDQVGLSFRLHEASC